MSEPVRTSTLSPAGPDSSPAHAAPNPERTSPLIAVRDTLGNRGFGAFLQTQLTIGRPDDSYETEADQVADHVMRMPEPSGAPPAIRSLSADPGHRVRRQMEEEEEEEEEEDADDLGDSTGFDVQRKCAECEEEETAAGMVQRKYAECKQEEQAQGTIQRQMEEEEEEEEEEEAGTVQRQMEEGEEEEEETAVQTKRHPSTGPAAIAAGRAYFEPRFGRDFGAVRTHTGADADATSRALGARAYTFGSHIAFRDGAYAPHSDEGRRLMAHELTHVAQQGSAPFGATVQRKPIPPFDGFTADESVIHSLSPDPVPPVRRQMEEEEPEEDLGDDSGVGIQRKCAHCDEEEKGEEMIQRQMEEDEEAEDEGDGTIQRQAEDDEFEDAESEEEEETAVQASAVGGTAAHRRRDRVTRRIAARPRRSAQSVAPRVFRAALRT
jgi:hypothetical protein